MNSIYIEYSREIRLQWNCVCCACVYIYVYMLMYMLMYVYTCVHVCRQWSQKPIIRSSSITLHIFWDGLSLNLGLPTLARQVESSYHSPHPDSTAIREAGQTNILSLLTLVKNTNNWVINNVKNVSRPKTMYFHLNRVPGRGIQQKPCS